MDLRKFMFNLLPVYYRENDTYKVSGQGLLERFINTLGDELQEEMVIKLETLIDQLDPYTAANEYLSLLAYTMGNPPDITGNLDTYRTQVTQAIALYKYKGTKKGYDLLFAILGLKVEVHLLIPLTYNYDSNIRYDTGPRYDLTKCNTNCLEYDLIYSIPIGGIFLGKGVFTEEFDKRFGGDPLTESQKNNLIKLIISDFEPINTKLRNLLYDPYPENKGIFSKEFNLIYK